MVKADLITGFLGSGKTTFIRQYAKYLKEKGEKIAILENDLGAVNVDALLLGDTEKTMSRMIGYLNHAKPRSAEEIADEMLAIMEDRERWIKKKSAQYYNSRYNEILNYGLDGDEGE